MRYCSRELVCRLVVCLAAGIASLAQHAAGEEPAAQTLQQADWEARIEAALDAQGDWVFEGVPLQDVCEALQDKLGIDVVLDGKALEDLGIETRLPVTKSLRGISNRSFLNLMLSDLDLTHTKHLGALWITTHEVAESQLTIQVHPVGDLLVRDGVAERDYGLLIGAIRGNIASNSWDQVGGPGAIEGLHDAIVVSQTADVHERIDQFLATYRAVIASDTGAKEPGQTRFMLGAEHTAAIDAALDQPLTAEFNDIPLRDAVAAIADTMQIPIVIDTRALDDFGLDASTPVRHKFAGTPLRFALARLLYELELTYTVRDEVLLVTTPEQAEAQLLIELYPVRDLVEVGDDLGIEPPGARYDFESLTGLIQSTVAPDSWEAVGGPSAIEALLPVPTIVIAQTQPIHDEIAQLLAKLRAAKRSQAATLPPQEAADPAALLLRSYPIYAIHTPNEILSLVMRACEPGTWSETPEAFAQVLGTSLVVKHNADGHRQVQKLLAQLGVLYPSGFKARSSKPGGGGGAFGGSSGGEQPAPANGGGGFF